MLRFGCASACSRRHAMHFLDFFAEERTAGGAVSRILSIGLPFAACKIAECSGIHRQDAHAVAAALITRPPARASPCSPAQCPCRLDGRHRRQQADHADNRRYHDVRAAFSAGQRSRPSSHRSKPQYRCLPAFDFQRLCCVFIHRADHFSDAGHAPAPPKFMRRLIRQCDDFASSDRPFACRSNPLN